MQRKVRTFELEDLCETLQETSKEYERMLWELKKKQAEAIRRNDD
jgi:hypothetical protein